ncbi:MAG: alanine:cation symporter family protein [Longibaculum sp.]
MYFTLNTLCTDTNVKEGISLLKEKAHSEDGVSSFQALMISTASRVGTGNIAGLRQHWQQAVQDPFWMWVIALIGGASAFVESTLAQIYKEKDGEVFRGGPAYYIEKALGNRFLELSLQCCLFLVLSLGLMDCNLIM